jgi:hypothetical protein
MIFKTLRVKATTVSVRLRIFSVRVNKYQQRYKPVPHNEMKSSELMLMLMCEMLLCVASVFFIGGEVASAGVGLPNPHTYSFSTCAYSKTQRVKATGFY